MTSRTLTTPTAKKARILTRESATFFYFFPIAIDKPPFDFITDVRHFLFLNHGVLHAADFFIPEVSCVFFSTVPFRFFMHAARKQCHRGHRINSRLFAFWRQ